MRASPSGKASASQADTRGFESRCPLHAKQQVKSLERLACFSFVPLAAMKCRKIAAKLRRNRIRLDAARVSSGPFLGLGKAGADRPVCPSPPFLMVDKVDVKAAGPHPAHWDTALF